MNEQRVRRLKRKIAANAKRTRGHRIGSRRKAPKGTTVELDKHFSLAEVGVERMLNAEDGIAKTLRVGARRDRPSLTPGLFGNLLDRARPFPAVAVPAASHRLAGIDWTVRREVLGVIQLHPLW